MNTPAYQGSGFVVTPTAALDGTSTVQAGGVMVMPSLQADQMQAQGTGHPDRLRSRSLDTAGYTANGAVYLTLTGTTPITLNFTNLAAATGVVVGGITIFTGWNRIVFYNTGTTDLVVAAAGSLGLRLPINGTNPSYTVPAGSRLVLDGVVGFAVDSEPQQFDGHRRPLAVASISIR